MQTEKSPYQYRGMFHALSTVLREEGPRALYKGWLPSVIGVVSTSFSNYCTVTLLINLCYDCAYVYACNLMDERKKP